MKKGVLVSIIVGSALLITGAVIFAVGLANANKGAQIVNKEYTLEEFHNVNIDIYTADLEFKATTDGSRKVVVEEREKQYHTVKVENDTLSITSVDTRNWWEKSFNFDWTSMKVTVYSPAGAFVDATIKNSTGDVTIPKDYSFNNLNINLSTGRIDIKTSVTNAATIESSTGNISLEMTAKNLNVKASTGNVYLNNTIVEEHLSVKTSTGDIRLTDCDAATIDLEASTGDIYAVLLTGKTFDVHTSTGSKSFPDSTPGAGLCKAKTSTGNINISVK